MKKKNHTRKIRGYKRKIRNIEFLLQYYRSYCKNAAKDRDTAIAQYQHLLERIQEVKLVSALRESDLFIAHNKNINIEEQVVRSFLHDLGNNEDFIKSIKVESRDEFDVGRVVYECSINVLTD